MEGNWLINFLNRVIKNDEEWNEKLTKCKDRSQQITYDALKILNGGTITKELEEDLSKAIERNK